MMFDSEIFRCLLFSSIDLQLGLPCEHFCNTTVSYGQQETSFGPTRTLENMPCSQVINLIHNMVIDKHSNTRQVF